MPERNRPMKPGSRRWRQAANEGGQRGIRCADRGFYGVSYDEEVKIFKDYIAPTDLTVKIKR